MFIHFSCLYTFDLLFSTASGDFCHLLITFAYSLDPDQAQQDVRPDLDPNRLTLCWYYRKILLKT